MIESNIYFIPCIYFEKSNGLNQATPSLYVTKRQESEKLQLLTIR